MSSGRKVSVLLLILLFSLSLVSCIEPVPDKDLQAAKNAIAMAENAKAKKYDPDNLQKARDTYKKSLNLLVVDDNAAARLLALQAKKSADLAKENAQKQVAKESIAEAEKMIKDAKEKNAGFLAPDLMQRAKQKLEDAKKNYSEKRYKEALTDAENSKEAAGRAKDKAIKKIAELNKALSDAEMALKMARNNPAVKKYASKELGNDESKLQSSKDSKKKVDDPASITANNDKMRNNLAKDAYEKALKNANDATAAANDTIRIALDREREAFRNQAKKKIDEAKQLIIQIEKLRKQGLIKGKAVEQLLKKLRKKIPAPAPGDASDGNTAGTGGTDTSSTNSKAKDYENKSNKQKYDAAVDALKRAENTYQGKSYKNSIKNSEEAIRIAKMIIALLKNTKLYIVRLIPAARDCLWRISKYKFIYGDSAMWPKIWKANKHLIVDPDLIYPGQKFRIPIK